MRILKKKRPVIAVVGSAGVLGSQCVSWFRKEGFDVAEIEKDTKDSVYSKCKAVAFVVCVPTPHGKDGSLDLTAVSQVCAKVPKGALTVVKSTVTPEFCRFLRSIGSRFVISPEFLDQDFAETGFRSPERSVYGADDWADAEIAANLFPQNGKENNLYMTPEEATVVKLAANSFFALKNVFFNGLYDLCSAIGADYEDVRKAVAADSRIGPAHTQVFSKGGRGAGGACLPKDFSQFEVLYRKTFENGNTMFGVLLQCANWDNVNRLKATGKAKEKFRPGVASVSVKFEQVPALGG